MLDLCESNYEVLKRSEVHEEKARETMCQKPTVQQTTKEEVLCTISTTEGCIPIKYFILRYFNRTRQTT